MSHDFMIVTQYSSLEAFRRLKAYASGLRGPSFGGKRLFSGAVLLPQLRVAKGRVVVLSASSQNDSIAGEFGDRLCVLESTSWNNRSRKLARPWRPVEPGTARVPVL